MSEDGEKFDSVLSGLVDNYREKLGVPTAEPLTLVLPRWLHDRVGEERLTSSFQRLGIDRVEVMEGYAESDKADILLYASGTWHNGHGIGETRVGCEGCA